MSSDGQTEIIRLENGHQIRVAAGLSDSELDALVAEYMASEDASISMPLTSEKELSWAQDHPDAPDNIRAPEKKELSATDIFIGSMETLGAIASGATTGALGGAIGAVDGAVGSYINGYRGDEFGSNVKARSDELAAQGTYMPRTEAGQQFLQSFGEAMAPLEALPPVVQAAAPGMVSRMASDAVHVGRADAYNAGVGRNLDPDVDLQRRMEAARTGGESLPSGERLSPSVGAAAADGVAPDITPDVAAMQLNRFVDPEVAQMYRDASPQTREMMINMLNQAQIAKPGSGVSALPRQVIGNSVGDRASMLAQIRQRYGQRITSIVEDNADVQVSTAQLGDDFGSILNRYKITRNEDGTFNLGKSRISDKEANAALKGIYERIEPKIANGTATFEELHVDKQWLQDMVDYDFGSQGGSAQLNNAIKDMAASVNGLLRKDGNGELTDYAKANDAFASTVEPFKEIKRMAKADDFDDLSDPRQTSELARKSRGLTNNTAQGVDLSYLLDDIEKLTGEAVERGVISPEEIAAIGFNPKTMKFNTDLNEAAQFASTVDVLFPQLRPTGLQGIMDQTAQSIGDSMADVGMNIATGGKYGALQGVKNYVTRKPSREERMAAERAAREQIMGSLFDILER